MTSSVDIGMFTAFRFVAGWGAWMLYAVIPILLNEIVPAHLRGALVDLHAVFLVFGYALSGWVGYGFYFWKSGGLKTWRPPMAISILFPVVLLALLPFLPESPRWLCMKGRVEEAEAILVRLHASPNDPNHDAAKAEFYQIKKQIEIDRTLGNSWMHIVKKPSYRKRALLCLGVAGFTQCCGILVISNYGPSIYSRLGYPPQTQLMLAALWMTVGWLCTIGAIFLVDRFSRPKYIAVGLFGCMACLIVEAALVANFVPSDNISALRAAIAMFFIFVFFYCGFIDGTQFSYMGEMFPTHLRAKGLCLGVSTISLMNIVWLQSAPTAFITIGWKFYLALIIPGTIGALIIWLYFPDTNGLPLEEVAAIFGDTDEIALYQRDLVVAESHTVVEMMHDQPRTKEVGA